MDIADKDPSVFVCPPLQMKTGKELKRTDPGDPTGAFVPPDIPQGSRSSGIK